MGKKTATSSAQQQRQENVITAAIVRALEAGPVQGHFANAASDLMDALIVCNDNAKTINKTNDEKKRKERLGKWVFDAGDIIVRTHFIHPQHR